MASVGGSSASQLATHARFSVSACPVPCPNGAHDTDGPNSTLSLGDPGLDEHVPERASRSLQGQVLHGSWPDFGSEHGEFLLGDDFDYDPMNHSFGLVLPCRN